MEEQLTSNSKKLDLALERVQQAETTCKQEMQEIKTLVQRSPGECNTRSQATTNILPTTTPSSVQERLQQIAQTPPAAIAAEKKDATNTALLIGDSNTKALIPDMLHDEKKVVIEPRMTLEQAFSNIPHQPKPQDVSDVVVLTGVNNIRQPNATVSQTIQKVDEVCSKYSTIFPNAKIHIGSVPPSNEKHIRYNTELKNLANMRQASFIPVDTMMDRNTGKLRSNMIRGFHYTPKGVSTLAKEVKRSLYGNYRARQTEIHYRNTNPTYSQGPPMPTSDCQSLPQRHSDPRQEMGNFLKMAFSCLENL